MVYSIVWQRKDNFKAAGNLKKKNEDPTASDCCFLSLILNVGNAVML